MKKVIYASTIASLCLICLCSTNYASSQKRHSAPLPPGIGSADSVIKVTSPTTDKRITGLRVYDPEKAFNGYTLFTTLTYPSIGIPGRTNLYPIYLIDMEGTIVHSWIISPAPSVSFARLKEDGNLLYITNDVPSPRYPKATSSGLRELDPESNEIFFYQGFIQHDFQVIDDDTFLILRDEMVYDPNPGFSPWPYLICPRKEIIKRDGTILWQWKAEDHLKELEDLTGLELPFRAHWEPAIKEKFLRKQRRERVNPFTTSLVLSRKTLLQMDPRVRERNKQCAYPAGDWAHSNTCEILRKNPAGEKDWRFREGNILFSFPTINTIGVIEFPSGRIVWAWGPGELDGQHTPTLLDNGNLLIFDNGPQRGWSRVIELDPLERKIVWEYRAEPKEGFFSTMLSNAVRLPNGNTLICEGFEDRMFEVTPDGEIVWDYVSTHIRTSGGLGIYRAYRYSPEEAEALFRRSGRTELIDQYKNPGEQP